LPWKQNALHIAPAVPEIIATRTTRAKSQRIAVTVSENTHAESKKIDMKTKNKPNKRVKDSKSKKIAVTVFIREPRLSSSMLTLTASRAPLTTTEPGRPLC
jgi:hypothetical protein